MRRDARSKDEKGKPNGPPLLDREAVEHARTIAGKSVIACDDLEADPLEKDGMYRNLADLERAFRELKTTIEIGPVRHRRADRIRAHVMIAVMARNLGAWLAQKSGLTIEAMQRLFANLRVQEIDVGGRRYWERTDLEPRQRSAIVKMGYDVPPKRFRVEVGATSNRGE